MTFAAGAEPGPQPGHLQLILTFAFVKHNQQVDLGKHCYAVRPEMQNVDDDVRIYRRD